MKLNLSQYAKQELRQSPLGKFWHDYHMKWSKHDRIKWRAKKMQKSDPWLSYQQAYKRAKALHDKAETGEPSPKDEIKQALDRHPQKTMKQLATFLNEEGLTTPTGRRWSRNALYNFIRRDYPKFKKRNRE